MSNGQIFNHRGALPGRSLGELGVLPAILAAQGRARELSKVRCLTAAARALIDHLETLGAMRVVGTGPVAERIIGAAVVLSAGRVEMADLNTMVAGAPTLLVDAAVASNAAAQVMAHRIRALGGGEVHVLVLAPATDVAAPLDLASWHVDWLDGASFDGATAEATPEAIAI